MLGQNNTTINTSEINFASSGGGAMLGYSGSPGAGNLYFSVSPSGTTDNYGNSVPTGLYVQAASIQGGSLTGTQMDSTSTLNGTSILTPTVLSPNVQGGTAASLVHTMTNSQGAVLGYLSGTFAATFATGGIYMWTVPTGITQVRIQCWGAGAGAGGGGGQGQQGGETGGGGEYAEEPAFQVNPGDVYTIIVGHGGQGGSTGQAGADGTASVVANAGGTGLQVTANPGTAGANFLGGSGGSGSNNSIHFDGGNGADASQFQGGASGGSSAAPSGQGNAGQASTSSTGAGTTSAPPGGGNGGAGGSNDLPGVNGTGPGGAGGGAGYSAVTSGTKTYSPSGGTYSYYGNDARANAGQLRNHDGPMYQGYDGDPSGHQYSFIALPYAQIQSDLAGVTVTSVSLTIRCLHSYYSYGVLCNMRYSSTGSFGQTTSNSGTDVQNFWVGQNATVTQNVGLGGGIGVALQNGNAKSILFGPTNTQQGLNAYGYYDSGSGNGTLPQLIVNYNAGVGSQTAGNGADGQVIISYGTASPAYTVGISAVSSTDPYGNTVQQGVTSPQLTLSNQATTPATLATSSVVTANSSGVPQATNSSGFSGSVVLAQTDTTVYTQTGTGLTQMSTVYTIPAGDPKENTIYRLKAYGSAVWGAGGRLEFQLAGPSGGPAGGVLIGGAAFNSGGQLSWSLEYTISVVSTGAAGTSNIAGFGAISVYTGSLSNPALLPTANTVNSIGFAMNNQAQSMNTNVVTNIQLNGGWASAPNNLTCYATTFERMGP